MGARTWPHAFKKISYVLITRNYENVFKMYKQSQIKTKAIKIRQKIEL
jgi:hypothetical protein